MEMNLIKHGRLITESELREDAIDLLTDTLEGYISWDETLEIANAYREWNGEPELCRNNEEELDEYLRTWSPHEILQAAANYSAGDDYFACDGDTIVTTSDEWEGLNIRDVATGIIDSDFNVPNRVKEVIDILNAYEEAKVELENYNPWRAKCQEMIRKYTSNEADVTDLLQLIDQLARHEEYWEEE